MKVCGTGRHVSRGRAYLLLFCVLSLGLFIGLSCGSDKRSVRPTGPDVPRLGPTIELDLDENGSADFVFEYTLDQADDVFPSAATIYLSVRPLGDNGVQYQPPQGCVPLPDSTLIDSALGWNRLGGPLARIDRRIKSGWESHWSSSWAGPSPMNLGLKLVLGDWIHFGWAKLSVDAESGSLTVHDYDHRINPRQPALAGVHGEDRCTEMGCSNGYVLGLQPIDGRFPAGRYDVHLSPEGDITRSCYFVVSDDPEECASGHCVRTENCNAVYMMGPDRDAVAIIYSVTEGPIRVEVQRDGTVVGAGTFVPGYRTVQPNGPYCGPTCLVGSNGLVVE